MWKKAEKYIRVNVKQGKEELYSPNLEVDWELDLAKSEVRQPKTVFA